MLVQRGTLRVGDSIVAGDAYGRVRAMLDEHGNQLEEALPSRPVQVLGLTSVPGAGDTFLVVDEDRVARQIADRRQARDPQRAERVHAASGSASRTSTRRSRRRRQLNLIIKGDNSGTVEALEDALIKIEVDDDDLAAGHPPRRRWRSPRATSTWRWPTTSSSSASTSGPRVRPRELADREGVDIRYYTVIYQAIDEIEAALKGMLKPESTRRSQLGTAEVREVFRVPRIGNVAGSLVRTGTIVRATPRRGSCVTVPWSPTT